MAIEDAQLDAHDSVLEEIKRQAMTEVSVAREDISFVDAESLKAQACADEADRKAAGASVNGSTEAVVYGEAAMDACGVKAVADTFQVGREILGGDPSDQNFSGLKKEMMRKPGFYAENLNSSGAGKFWKGLTGKDLFGDVGQAGDAVSKNAEETARTANINAENITAQSRVVKELTFSQEMASKQKYENAVAIQMQRGGPAGPGASMGGDGGMQRTLEHTLAMGPKGPSDDMLTEEEKQQGAMV